MGYWVAKVAVDKTSLHFDKLYSYIIPNEMTSILKVGCRVLVPFGKGNAKRQGLIFSIEQQEKDLKLKPLHSIIDQEPIVTEDLFSIIRFLVQTTFCSYYDAVNTILPKALKIHISPIYSLTDEKAHSVESILSEDEMRLIAFLRKSQSQLAIDQFLDVQNKPEKKKILQHLHELGIVTKSEEYKQEVGDSTLRMVRLSDGLDLDTIKLTKKQKEVVQLLQQIYAGAAKEICYFCGITEVVLKNLEKKGIIEYFLRENYRNPYEYSIIKKEDTKKTLTKNQRLVYDNLYNQYKTRSPSVALLRGVTGSGKTEIFLKLIQKTVEENKQAIMMVPEISLTPQMIAVFQERFGQNIAVMHSSLSVGERLDEWKRMKRGEANIVIGTRSAVFAPFENIGIIIMDEEGENSYKSESSPRYHAREVAKLRCVRQNAMLLLASATPSIESYYYAKNGRYTLYELHERYNDIDLPNVKLIDLRNEHLNETQRFISDILAEEIYGNLKNKEQSILLLNRRGYQTFASCIDCGEVIQCPNCSVALTYHKANGYMMCHYCGYSQRPDMSCPVCNSPHMLLSGMGTQKIEDELETRFPDARILRMDADTTYSRIAFEEKFASFANGEYDIMVGTQMIAKGLNFPNITLVGVLSADQSLYGNNYKCAERTFSLLTQVIGRGGRGDKRARAFIQTYSPDNPVLGYAAKQDYVGFYEDEIIVRKALNFPPFCDMCKICFYGTDEKLTIQAANHFIHIFAALMKKVAGESPIQILGPSKAAVFKVSNKFRYQVIIKYKNSQTFRRLLKKALINTAGMKPFSKLTIFADVYGET